MITELKPTNLIVVEIPKEAKGFCIKEHIVRNAIDSRDEYELNFQNNGKEEYLILRHKYKILGEVTKDKIGFDVEPYVEKGKIPSDLYWMDYNWDGNHTNERFNKTSSEESFYSLLAANGGFFKNPVSYPVVDEYEGKDDWRERNINDDIQHWQSFEDRLIKGKLLILEKI